MYCIHCGKKIEHEGQFCIYCGAKIYDEKEAEAEPIEADASLQEEKPEESDSVSEEPVKETVEINESAEIKAKKEEVAPIEAGTENTIASDENATGKKRAVVAAIFIAIIVITALIIVIVHFTRKGSGKEAEVETPQYDTETMNEVQDIYDTPELDNSYIESFEDEDLPFEEASGYNFEYDYSNPIIGIDSVHASSQLPDEGQYNYDPLNLFDGDITTAYVEGVEGLGLGETITINLSDFYLITGLRIVPGYNSTPEVFEKNSAPTGFNIYYYNCHDEVIQETVDIAPVNFGGEYSLFKDYPEIADIYMIKIEIIDAQPGTRYEDTCISEIYIDGFPRVEE